MSFGHEHDEFACPCSWARWAVLPSASASLGSAPASSSALHRVWRPACAARCSRLRPCSFGLVAQHRRRRQAEHRPPSASEIVWSVGLSPQLSVGAAELALAPRRCPALHRGEQLGRGDGYGAAVWVSVHAPADSGSVHRLQAPALVPARRLRLWFRLCFWFYRLRFIWLWLLFSCRLRLGFRFCVLNGLRLAAAWGSSSSLPTMLARFVRGGQRLGRRDLGAREQPRELRLLLRHTLQRAAFGREGPAGEGQASAAGSALRGPAQLAHSGRRRGEGRPCVEQPPRVDPSSSSSFSWRVTTVTSTLSRRSLHPPCRATSRNSHRPPRPGTAPRTSRDPLEHRVRDQRRRPPSNATVACSFPLDVHTQSPPAGCSRRLPCSEEKSTVGLSPPNSSFAAAEGSFAAAASATPRPAAPTALILLPLLPLSLSPTNTLPAGRPARGALLCPPSAGSAPYAPAARPSPRARKTARRWAAEAADGADAGRCEGSDSSSFKDRRRAPRRRTFTNSQGGRGTRTSRLPVLSPTSTSRCPA